MERENWEEYKKRLIIYGYTEEEISAVKEIRENCEHCSDDQFKELVSQGIVVRTRKLRKKRNYYVNEEGQFLYLCSYHKKYQHAGFFKTEE